PDLPTAPTATNPELERNLERAAPVREPRYLQRERLANGALRTVVELPAIADSYIASARPNQNFGGDSLYLGYSQLGNGFGAERLLVRFDIAGSIPDNATINSARLRLRLAFSSPTEDAAMPTVLRRLASHWNESTVTWNSEPSWTDIDDRTSVGSELDWYEWEISAEVSAWVTGTPNHGIEIIGDERVQQRERAFYARETNTEYFPRLLVDYTAIDDDQPPRITVDPLPAYTGRNFTVTWSGDDPGEAGIAYYDIQYRVDGGDWIDWLTEVTRTVEEFPSAQNGRTYEFRARGVDEVGNVEPFGEAEAATTVDTLPPETTVIALPASTDEPSFTVSWAGTDNGGSGIQYYDVRYQVNNGSWLLWQERTTATSALFRAPADGFYAFEARAVDNRGNVEEWRGAEAAITVDMNPPFLTVQAYLPLVYR
ncbi:MAG: fibronectin type III domain-containing protein, partial [Caldilineaceae bacterium]|nr:fibronectin type III domain-containing protein [Caldilineaceae bacterium]